MFKDTKEGQTHFFGDNCGEPEHNPLSNKSVEIIKEVANRFLGWKLPKDFSPDCGISFDKKHEPVGTNLFTATQAEEMVRFILTDTLLSERQKIKDDLLKIADENEYEDMRKEIIRYFYIEAKIERLEGMKKRQSETLANYKEVKIYNQVLQEQITYYQQLNKNI